MIRVVLFGCLVAIAVLVYILLRQPKKGQDRSSPMFISLADLWNILDTDPLGREIRVETKLKICEKAKTYNELSKQVKDTLRDIYGDFKEE